LSFAIERIGPLAAIIITVFYLLALYLFVLPNTPKNQFASIYSESLIKTTCQHLLLLVGFDTLIYRKYYDTPPILVGHHVPADSRREVLMGYQYALHQRRRKLREEKDMFMRSQGNNSASSGGYWDEYSDASESSIERHRDPKHSRRTTALTREESHTKSESTHPSDEEEDFVQETSEAALVAAQAYLLTTQPKPEDPREHMHQAAI
jgi:hypothetical protein